MNIAAIPALGPVLEVFVRIRAGFDTERAGFVTVFADQFDQFRRCLIEAIGIQAAQNKAEAQHPAPVMRIAADLDVRIFVLQTA